MWDPAAALALGDEGLLKYWHTPERANAIIQLVNPPQGWQSACMVPWFPEAGVLAPVAHIEHERVVYTVNTRKIPHAASIAVEHFFTS